MEGMQLNHRCVELIGGVGGRHTVFFAEDEDEVGGAVLEVGVQVGHEADQAALHRGALLRPLGRVPQRRQDLTAGINKQLSSFKQYSPSLHEQQQDADAVQVEPRLRLRLRPRGDRQQHVEALQRQRRQQVDCVAAGGKLRPLTSLGSCRWLLQVMLKKILRISMILWEASREMGGAAGSSTHSYWSFHWTSRQLSRAAVKMDTPPSCGRNAVSVRQEEA
ncbi:hypothetical protein EYF80_061082 [Liparis tanakae]|uniref:Uncharacterized protein n=1 Tax=Liparis tanakae TaxID=230148 RepID=A0A4Z2EJL3_9TELE|nr:hypothetical protein EYF80_061082 [Liparis tanakae]